MTTLAESPEDARRILRALPVVLGPERVADLADRARVRFRAAA